MSRDCRECGNCGGCGSCGSCGGCNGHNHDDRCEFIACEKQLRAAKEAIREAEEILEGKYFGGECDGHKGGHDHGHDCGCRDLRKCEFELRIANKKIIESAAVLNEYIDEYIKDDCDCCECDCCCTSCCTSCGCSFDTCCSNYYDNPNKYDRETGCKDRCNCGCGCWGR